MPKTSTIFVCSNCGQESPKWFGKCPGCNEWNTCYEEKTVKRSGGNLNNKPVSKPTSLNDVKNEEVKRASTGFEELDRVLRWRTSKGLVNIATEENQALESLLLFYKYVIK